MNSKFFSMRFVYIHGLLFWKLADMTPISNASFIKLNLKEKIEIELHWLFSLFQRAITNNLLPDVEK